jgi:hypothetical protein
MEDQEARARQSEGRPFAAVSDAWLDDIVVACDAAAREGAFDPDGEAADGLRHEYVTRGRSMPGAWGAGHADPAEWGR